MPTRDVELLRYRSLSEFSGTNNLRRAQSEANVIHGDEDFGGRFPMLKLSKTRVTVGDSLTVYWDIHENCSANDWIGLFDLGELWVDKNHNQLVDPSSLLTAALIIEVILLIDIFYIWQFMPWK